MQTLTALELQALAAANPDAEALAAAIAKQLAERYEAALAAFKVKGVAEVLNGGAEPKMATLWPKFKRQIVSAPGKPDTGYGAMLDTHRESFQEAWAYEIAGGGNPPPKYAQAYAFLGWWSGRESLKASCTNAVGGV